MHSPCITIYHVFKAFLLISRRSVSVSILLLVSLSMSANSPLFGQSIQPLTHPNHYILLIDASGSNVTPETKRRVYEKALLEHLLPRLYRQGFSETIPPYDPNQDWLTLHHFGIVTGDRDAAYSRLASYDFLREFIHSTIAREKAVSPDNLREKLIPTQTYQYTILSWAKELALHQLRLESGHNLTNRTFLILVHDGVPNENSLAEEVEMVRRWARPNYEKVAPLISTIDSKYRFTDGKGNNSPTWSEEVHGAPSDTPAPIFIEAYEVVSVAQVKWEAEGKQIAPLDDLALRWIKETGDAPEGVLTASLNERFKSWISSADSSEVSFNLEGGRRLPSSNVFEMPVVFPSALSCTPRTFKAELNVSMQQTDELLGIRQVNYTYPQMVTAPRPLSCTAYYYFSRGLALLLALMFIAGVAYCAYYRFYGTHIKIEIPGTIVPINLKRKSQITASVISVPQKEIEALSLKLPSLLKQHLFYRGATITLAAQDGASVHWSDDRDDSEIQLPLAREYVLAYWSKLPDKPSTITVNYQQGRQHAGVSLSYPSGSSEHLKGAKNDLRSPGFRV